MNEIAQNKRRPLTDIDDKLHSSTKIINYKIKKLIKSGFIRALEPRSISQNWAIMSSKAIFFLEFKHICNQ